MRFIGGYCSTREEADKVRRDHCLAPGTVVTDDLEHAAAIVLGTSCLAYISVVSEKHVTGLCLLASERSHPKLWPSMTATSDNVGQIVAWCKR